MEEMSLHHRCNLAEHQKLLALNLTSPHYIFTAEELVTVDEHSGNVTKEKENYFFCNIRYHLGMLQRRKTTTTQTRIEARFNSFLAEPLDLFCESLKYSSFRNIIFMVHSLTKTQTRIEGSAPYWQAVPRDFFQDGLRFSEFHAALPDA